MQRITDMAHACFVKGQTGGRLARQFVSGGHPQTEDDYRNSIIEIRDNAEMLVATAKIDDKAVAVTLLAQQMPIFSTPTTQTPAADDVVLSDLLGNALQMLDVAPTQPVIIWDHQNSPLNAAMRRATSRLQHET